MKFRELKVMVAVEQLASQDWAKATVAWASAAASWEAVVRKNPGLSEVRLRWASAGRSWMAAGGDWTPGFDKSWLPGNQDWTYGSCNWAAASRRWALASLNWAAAAERYPGCGRESLQCAYSSADWASAARAWAKPQSIWERPLFRVPVVCIHFAVAAENAADLASWARAGARLPPLHNHSGSVSEECKALGIPWMENAVYGRRKDLEVPVAKASAKTPVDVKLVDSAPENRAAREDTGSVAGTKPSENHAARDDVTSSVANGEPSVTERIASPKDQVRGTSVKPSLPEDLKDRAAAEKPHEASTGEKKARGKVLENVASPQDQASGTSVKRSLLQEVKSSAVAVDRAAAEKPNRAPTGHLPDLNDLQVWPGIAPADPKVTRPPKPGRQRHT